MTWLAGERPDRSPLPIPLRPRRQRRPQLPKRLRNQGPPPTKQTRLRPKLPPPHPRPHGPSRLHLFPHPPPAPTTKYVAPATRPNPRHPRPQPANPLLNTPRPPPLRLPAVRSSRVFARLLFSHVRDARISHVSRCLLLPACTDHAQIRSRPLFPRLPDERLLGAPRSRRLLAEPLQRRPCRAPAVRPSRVFVCLPFSRVRDACSIPRVHAAHAFPRLRAAHVFPRLPDEGFWPHLAAGSLPRSRRPSACCSRVFAVPAPSASAPSARPPRLVDAPALVAYRLVASSS